MILPLNCCFSICAFANYVIRFYWIPFFAACVILGNGFTFKAWHGHNWQSRFSTIKITKGI